MAVAIVADVIGGDVVAFFTFAVFDIVACVCLAAFAVAKIVTTS